LGALLRLVLQRGPTVIHRCIQKGNRDKGNRWNCARRFGSVSYTEESWRYRKKFQVDTFYRAHATWFLEEVDHIVARVPRNVTDPLGASGLREVLLFVRPVVFDSLLVFDNWGTYRAGVPGVYGVGKNIAEHMMAFYQGAKQTIYGHGSFNLSFIDNHADLATATIRQAIEIRLRRGFGILGKVRKSDDSFHPIPLSDILDAIDVHRNKVRLPVRFENIKRINGWANLYLHGGLKLYAWTPPRVLEFLRVFIIGGPAPGWSHSSKAGVACDIVTFDAIREIVRAEHEGQDFDLQLLEPVQCEALISDGGAT
jgi:hypothetical protein